jgi:uncharacterized protein YndB with AHSA1/START domain
MADIEQELPIAAPLERVYEAVSTPAGLNEWWTKTASGVAALGAEFTLGFGPEYQWRGVATRVEAPGVFELRLTASDADWKGTKVGFELSSRAATTWVHFYHRGWPVANQHFRVSCHCWALYLRILRRHLEDGEAVPYERRLMV